MRNYLNLKWISLAVAVLLLLFYLLAVYWSSEPMCLM